MSWTLINNVKGHSAADADTFTTASIDTSGADLLVAVHAGGGSPTVSDSKGNTWTLATEVLDASHIHLHFAWNATVGTGHTFTLTGTDFYGSLQVYAYSGSLVSSTPLDQTHVAWTYGATTLQPGSVTPTTDGQLLVAGLNHDTSTTPTINSSFTSPAGAGTGYGDVKGDFGFVGSHSAYFIQTTAAAINPTWTSANGNLYTLIATFKAASGSGGAAPTGPLLGVASAAFKLFPLVALLMVRTRKQWHPRKR